MIIVLPNSVCFVNTLRLALCTFEVLVHKTSRRVNSFNIVTHFLTVQLQGQIQSPQVCLQMSLS